MESFRVLHLSDLHFASRPNHESWVDLTWSDIRAFRELLDRGAEDYALTFVQPSSHDLAIVQQVAFEAYKEGPNLDAILITGDLATTGNIEDLSSAFDFVHAGVANKYQTDVGQPTLQGANAPIFVLPGNHDRFVGPSWIPPFWSSGGRSFDEVFEHYWPGNAIRRWLLERDNDHRLAIIAADFSLASDDDADVRLIGRLGQGRVYPQILAELTAATEAERNDSGAAIVWAVHFPPAFPNCSRSLRLILGSDLLDAARRCNVKDIFCGHIHQPIRYVAPRFPRTSVHAAGSTCQCTCGSGNAFHVHEISVEAGAVVNCQQTDFIWNETRFERFS